MKAPKLSVEDANLICGSSADIKAVIRRTPDAWTMDYDASSATHEVLIAWTVTRQRVMVRNGYNSSASLIDVR